MNEELKESLKKVINAELKKGTMLHVEVAKVLGTDIVGMEVHTEGNRLAVLKMLISAMAANQQLNELINAAVLADEFLHVEAVKLNMKNSEEKGGQA
ncbi:MAG: hypothetical protein PUD23_07295 [Prevotella sp.]|nr:hypothetical protein [Prevotella sp.]